MAYKFNPFTGKLEEYGPVLTGTGTVSAAADGTAALPGIAFANDLNTGIYRPGADALGLVTGGTERLLITSAGLVGIGTSSPGFAVDISAPSDAIVRSRTNGNTSAGFIGSTNNGTNNWFFGSRKDSVGGTSGTDRFNLLYDANAFLTVTTGGNVGIGTTNFGGKLTVKTSSSNGAPVAWGDGQLVVTAGDGTTAPGFGISTNTSDNSVSLSALTPGTGWNNLHLRAAQTIFYKSDAASNEVGRWDSSGRLLVGTSSAQGDFTLQIQGNAASAAAAGSIYLRRGLTTAQIGGNVGADLGSIDFGANDGTIAGRIECLSDATWSSTSDTPGRLVFSTTADGASSPTERMRIDSAGHLGLGATPSAWSGSSARGFNIGTRAVLFNISSGSLFGDNWYFNGTNDIRIEAGYASRIFCNDTGQITTQTTGTSTAGSTITWTQGPYIANGGTSWTNSSDERLKTITGEISDALNKVSQLRAAEFYWNADENKTQQVGLIAQDLLEVLPQVVVVPETKEKEDDSYGKQSYLGVNYDQVIPLLVAALKESGERIETLEAKVAALEAA